MLKFLALFKKASTENRSLKTSPDLRGYSARSAAILKHRQAFERKARLEVQASQNVPLIKISTAFIAR